MTSEHDAFLLRATELAASAREKGNHPFGSILVADGIILEEAENTVNTAKDPTGHAETNLVRLACKRLDRDIIARSTLYTSTLPCREVFARGQRQVEVVGPAGDIEKARKVHEGYWDLK